MTRNEKILWAMMGVGYAACVVLMVSQIVTNR